jgi:hypothetical protein
MAMREKRWERARTEFVRLTTEFSANAKFARERTDMNGATGPDAQRG